MRFFVKSIAMDRNFDGLSHYFNDRIYGTLKGQLRLKMLDLDLAHLIEASPLNVIDVGGGMGQFSAHLAKLGHHLTLTDISQDMLEQAKFNFAQHDSIPAHFICTPLQCLPQLQLTPFDLVLNHAVLEWLADPLTAIEHLYELCQPDGHISLMFYNRHTLVWRNLMNGSWQRVNNHSFHHDKNQLMPQNPLDPKVVIDKTRQLGLELISYRGIRCVHDHMPKHIRETKSLEDFVALESSIGLQAPYRDLGRYIHLLLRKTEK